MSYESDRERGKQRGIRAWSKRTEIIITHGCKQACERAKVVRIALVFEVPHPGEDHREIVFVCSGYYLFVAH